MSDNELENAELSLASIAGLDVSDVEEIHSSQLPAMIGTFEVTATSLGKKTIDFGDGDEVRIEAVIIRKVIEVDSIIEKGIEDADVMGKTIQSNFLIDPARAQEGIGKLKGHVSESGFDPAGAIGGLPEEERDENYVEGFLDKMIGHTQKGKIVKKKPRKGGDPFSRFQTIPPKKAKA